LRGDWSHAANVRGGAVAPRTIGRVVRGPPHRLIASRFSEWLDMASVVGRIELDSKVLRAQS